MMAYRRDIHRQIFDPDGKRSGVVDDSRLDPILEKLDRMQREEGYHNRPPHWEVRRRRNRRIAAAVAGVLGLAGVVLALR